MSRARLAGVPPGLIESVRDSLPEQRRLGVLPTPAQVLWQGPPLRLNEAAILLTADEGARSLAEGLRGFLRSEGVSRIPVVASEEAAARYSAVIALGNPEEDKRIAHYWQAAGRGDVDWEGLGEEGYALACCQRQGHLVAVVAAPQAVGLRRGCATLRQMVYCRRKPWVKQAVLIDKPAFRIRGVIEGFYGPPWTHAQRMRMLAFLEDVKCTHYAYAPKEDPLHRERWREPYPARHMREFAQLAEAAQSCGVKFVFCISPGLSIGYSSRADFSALCRKVTRALEAGAWGIGLLLDDIAAELKHEEDRRAFPDLAAAQAHLANRLLQFIRRKCRDAELWLCPTEYVGVAPSPYLSRLGRALHSDIKVFWTGREVCSPSISAADADGFGSGIRRQPLIWDNYPVNDYRRTRLLLGPLRGRDADLPEHCAGVMSNPMNEAEASRLPLMTVADYLWNPAAYRPEDSWHVALMHWTAPEHFEPLRLFAEQSRSSFLDKRESEALDRLVEACLAEADSGAGSNCAQALLAHLRRLEGLEDSLRRRIGDLALWADVKDYAAKLRLLSRAGIAAVAALERPGSVALLRLQAAVRRCTRNEKEICGDAIQRLITKVMNSKGG